MKEDRNREDARISSGEDTGTTRRTMLFRLGVGGLTFTSLPALLAACGDGSGSGKAADTLRIGVTSEIDTLNPFVQQSAAAVVATHLLYPTLTRQEGNPFAVQPDLAESYQVTDNGKEITFALRTNGKWSDGKPVTAYDAEFTIKTLVRLKASAAALLAQYVIGIRDAVAKDAKTLVVSYDKTIPNALALLSRVAILPQHVWKAAASGDGAGLKSLAVTDGAVGGGQFTLKKYTPKQIVLMRKHSGWYGKPHSLATLGFMLFGSPDAMLKALQTGQIDAVALLSPSAALKSMNSAKVKFEQAPGFIMNNLYFNVNPKKTRHRELLNPEVRRALSLAIDRKRIVEVALFGMGTPGGSLVYPAMGDWHDSSITPDPFDVAQANKILDGLGYARGADGVRRAGSERMHYTINLANKLAGGDRIVQIITSGWEQVGVKVTTRSLDAAAMIDAIGAPDGKYLTNDIAVWGFLPANPDPAAVLQHFVTASIGSFNNCHYSDPEYDRLFKQQSSTLDVAARRELVHKMQRRFFDARAMLALCYVNALSATGPQFKGISMSAFGPFNSISRDQITKITPA